MKIESESAGRQNVPEGYRAYKLKGVEGTIIAKKGGPKPADIKTKSSYSTLRKNQQEFGVASMLSKTLRDSLSEGMSQICETYVSGRLTAQFRNLAKFEEGPLGTRPIYPSRHGHKLNGFEFNTNSPHEKVFGAKYFIKRGSRKDQVILHFPAFVPEDTFVMPDGTTNFKITARVVALSDYQYDKNLNKYEAVCPDLHGKFGEFSSAMLPVLKMPTEPMTAMVSLNENEVPDGLGFFLVLAVSFFRYQNGEFIHLNKGSGMTIKQVY